MRRRRDGGRRTSRSRACSRSSCAAALRGRDGRPDGVLRLRDHPAPAARALSAASRSLAEPGRDVDDALLGFDLGEACMFTAVRRCAAVARRAVGRPVPARRRHRRRARARLAGGVWCAARPRSRASRALEGVAMVFFCAPAYVVGFGAAAAVRTAVRAARAAVLLRPDSYAPPLRGSVGLPALDARAVARGRRTARRRDPAADARAGARLDGRALRAHGAREGRAGQPVVRRHAGPPRTSPSLRCSAPRRRSWSRTSCSSSRSSRSRASSGT